MPLSINPICCVPPCSCCAHQPPFILTATPPPIRCMDGTGEACDCCTGFTSLTLVSNSPCYWSGSKPCWFGPDGDRMMGFDGSLELSCDDTTITLRLSLQISIFGPAYIAFTWTSNPISKDSFDCRNPSFTFTTENSNFTAISSGTGFCSFEDEEGNLLGSPSITG